jgi:PAS domain-containing protein
MGDKEVLGQICRAKDLPEALSIFFDALLTTAEVEQALVLLDDRQALRGVLGMGWERQIVEGIRVPLERTEDPLVAAYRAGEPAVVRYEMGEEPVVGGRFLAFPIPGIGGEESGCFGLLLVGPDHREPEELGGVLGDLPEIGAVLARIAELEQVRSGQRESEQQRDLLTSLVNALPDPVLITDAENNILLENRRAESLFTASEDDSEGRRRAVEINNLLFSSFLTRSAIGGGAEGDSRELNLVDPTEGGDLLFEVLSTALPLSLVGEKTMVSVLRDVTDLKRATTELEAQFKRVRAGRAEVAARAGPPEPDPGERRRPDPGHRRPVQHHPDEPGGGAPLRRAAGHRSEVAPAAGRCGRTTPSSPPSSPTSR